MPALREFKWQRHPAAGIHCGWKPQPLAAAREAARPKTTMNLWVGNDE
jgi:hypothetical protein